MNGLVAHTSDVDDDRRWLDLDFRDGDVVISTRSKHGTTGARCHRGSTGCPSRRRTWWHGSTLGSGRMTA